MIFIIRGGTTKKKNVVVNAIAQLADMPVYRRSIMNLPLMVLQKSTDPKAQYITDICHSYIGNTLAISEKRSADTRITRPGDKVITSNTGIHDDVKTIAQALCKYINPLFLFRTTLKYVSRQNERHQVFVDLQYKEELDILTEKVSDKKVIINLISNEKDDLLPEIEGLTLLTDEDLADYDKANIPAESSLNEVKNQLYTQNIFKGSIENDVGFAKEAIHAEPPPNEDAVEEEPLNEQEEAIIDEVNAEHDVDFVEVAVE
jgi:hypothetical protein